MALIYIYDNGGLGTDKTYRADDIVAVFEDCPVELPPASPFRILKIVGATKAQVEKFTEPHIDDTDPDNPIITYPRKWKLDLAVIPSAWRNAFLADNYNECTPFQAKKYMLNKVTNLHDDGT
jgi:hypothetical protein